jgi:hypothetical protein
MHMLFRQLELLPRLDPPAIALSRRTNDNRLRSTTIDRTRRSGQKINVRFPLGGDRGPEVMKWGSPRLLNMDCTTGQIEPLDTSDGVGTNLPQAPPVTFQKGPDRYTFTWEPSPSLANSCKALLFEFIDGWMERGVQVQMIGWTAKGLMHS